MSLHFWHRRRLTLLAAGALGGREEEATLAHAAACTRCAAELADLRAFLGRLEADPVRAEVAEARPAIDAADLLAEVQRRIDRSTARPQAAPAAAWRWGFALPALATAFALAALAGPALIARWKGETAPVAEVAAPTVSAEALDRLERNLTREQTARYLSEAQDVLATVAASPRDCDKDERRLDVEAESRRSRELLARRAFLGVEEDAVASARPVLDDVEQVLREVASLEDCVRRGDVERLREEIARRQLLMKMRLMQRELLG
jgi:hypothetical protein